MRDLKYWRNTTNVKNIQNWREQSNLINTLLLLLVWNRDKFEIINQGIKTHSAKITLTTRIYASQPKLPVVWLIWIDCDLLESNFTRKALEVTLSPYTWYYLSNDSIRNIIKIILKNIERSLRRSKQYQTIALLIQGDLSGSSSCSHHQ